MQRDPDMVSTYDTWRALSESTKASSKPQKVPREKDNHAPATPRKKQKFHAPPVSPGNPFRSPQKPTKHYTKQGAFPSCNMEQDTTYESDVSEEDEPMQPYVALTPKKPSPAVSGTSPMPLYTPRTKARKRLRGEDVRTPPQAKMQRIPSQSRTLPLLAQSPSSMKTDERRSFSRILSGHHDHQDDVIGPSPSKNAAHREFLPLFSQPDTHAQEHDHDMLSDPASPAISASGTHDPISPKPLSQLTETAVHINDDTSKCIKILPYRRFGSTKSQASLHPDELDLNLPRVPSHEEEEMGHDETVWGDHLTDLETHSLLKSMMHGKRAVSEQRARSDQLVQHLFSDDTSKPNSAIIQRQGRAGLDAEEDMAPPSENGSTHDDDWASESSSIDYGLGDGDMDSYDVE